VRIFHKGRREKGGVGEIQTGKHQRTEERRGGQGCGFERRWRSVVLGMRLRRKVGAGGARAAAGKGSN